MAVETVNKPNTIAPGGDYPFGDIKDDDGSGNGTPANRLVFADFFQFFSKILNNVGITANGLAENVTNGYQYFTAFTTQITNIATALINTAMAQVNGVWTQAAITDITQVASLPVSYSGTSMSGVTGQLRYKIIGKTMHVTCFAQGTTTMAATYLLIKLPAGVTTKTGSGQYGSCSTNDATVSVAVILQIAANSGGDYIALSTMVTGSFASSHQYATFFSFTFEIN